MVTLKPRKYWHLSFLFFFRATMGNVALITAGLALKNVELKVNVAYLTMTKFIEELNYTINMTVRAAPAQM